MPWQALVDEADHEIFRRNGFRILRLPSTATTREICRAAQLRAFEAANASRKRWPLDLTADNQAIDRACHRLEDPFLRLVDEVFWFWPQNLDGEMKDKATELILEGEIRKAFLLWTEWEKPRKGQVGPRTLAAVHNLGVLYLCMACEWELKLLAGELQQVSGLVKDELGELWQEAFLRWVRLIEEKALAAALKNYLLTRLTQLGERQLRPETETVTQLCQTLPLAIVLITANVAAHLARRAHWESVSKLRSLLDDSGFDKAVVQQALHSVLRKEQTLIHELCATYEERASKSPSEGVKCARLVVNECGKILRLLERLLGANDPLLSQCSDEVCLALKCQVAYGNSYEDWETSLRVLREIRPLAKGAQTRQKIELNIKTVEQNWRSGECWASPGYRELPPPTFTEVERARELYRQGKGGQAAEILINLFARVDWTRVKDLPTNHPARVIARCLAAALRAKASTRLREVLEASSRPPSLLEAIKRNPSMAALAMALHEAGIGDRCAICGLSVDSEGTVFLLDDLKLPLCKRHTKELGQELASRKRIVTEAVQAAYADLCLARQVCPENKLVREAIDQVEELASELEITLDRRLKQRVQPATQVTNTSVGS